VTAPVRVLIVDDEPLIADAHRAYVERVDGFEVAAIAHTAGAALAALRAAPVDLVLLDLHLPDRNGLEVVRAMRAAGSSTDVLAVTSARDIAMVRQALSLGVTQYLLKPFTFAALRQKLDRYARFRRELLAAGDGAAQHEIDRVLATLRGDEHDTLPKGIDPHTLDVVLGALRDRTAPGGRSAAEIATSAGTSRVTARRYLEHLADTGRVVRGNRYGGLGRPEVEYRLT
jgi:response regulator of citrate/malate metabolism